MLMVLCSTALLALGTENIVASILPLMWGPGSEQWPGELQVSQARHAQQAMAAWDALSGDRGGAGGGGEQSTEPR